jgi:undecaprenyl-diphosphatase
MIASLDRAILLFCNQLAGRSSGFDGLVMFVSHNGLVKGGPYAALWWWHWFRNPASRPRVVAASAAAVAAIFVARVLATVLPFRARPFDSSDLTLHPTAFQSQVHTLGWSAFPSDHAAFFFALATGFLLISRRTGIAALLHAAVFICLPRVYLGIHYPSDLAAGAAIGAAAAWVANRERVVRLLTTPWLASAENAPAWFYAAAFLFTYQMAEVFDQGLELLAAIRLTAKLTFQFGDMLLNR